MSADFLSLLDPYDYDMDPAIIDPVRAQAEKVITDGVLVNPADQEPFMLKLRDAIVTLNHRQIGALKPAIPTLDGENIKSDSNCTDIALAGLAVCREIGLRAYARCDTTHADIVVPGNDQLCWRVDNYKGNALLNSSSEPIRTWHSAQSPPLKNTDGHTGIMYAAGTTRRIYSPWIRDYTQRILDEITTPERINGAIILEGTTAVHSLRAIDVLRKLLPAACKQPELMPTYEAAKAQLLPFVPKLNRRKVTNEV